MFLRAFWQVGIEDLSNQIGHWDVYRRRLRELGQSPGQFLAPITAEWFSGALGLFSTLTVCSC